MEIASWSCFETEGEPYDQLDGELRCHYLDLLGDVG
jgi:hypothetical protein